MHPVRAVNIMKSILLQYLITDVVGTVLDYCVNHKEEKLNGEFRSSFQWNERILFAKSMRETLHWRWWVSARYWDDLITCRCHPFIIHSTMTNVRSFVNGNTVENALPARYIFSLHLSDVVGG